MAQANREYKDRLFKFIFSANEILKDFSNPDYLTAFVAANRVKEISNL